MPLGISGKQAAGGHQGAFVANRGEDIAERAIVRRGVADAVGGEQRKVEVAGDLDCNAVAGFFFAMKVALQFDVNVVAAEDASEVFDRAAGFSGASFL